MLIICVADALGAVLNDIDAVVDTEDFEGPTSAAFDAVCCLVPVLIIG